MRDWWDSQPSFQFKGRKVEHTFASTDDEVSFDAAEAALDDML